MPRIVIAFLTGLFSVALNANEPDSRINSQLKKQEQSITFTENKGQVSDQNYKPRPDVLFSGSTNGMVYHLRNNGISYQLNRIDSWKEEENKRSQQKLKVADRGTSYRLDLQWLNCNPQAAITKDETLTGYSNYYLKVCPQGVTHVKTYSGVTYRDIYDNIDLHYYAMNGSLKYDYLVAAYADYSQIQLSIEGAEAIELQKDGSLILRTPLGEIKEGKPLVFQRGKQLKARWKVHANTLSFDIENYNPKYAMIIDPTVRVWGTYYGSNFSDIGFAACTDASGNVYLGGQTASNSGTFIATSGSHQSSFFSGSVGFLAKFNTNGLRQWGTYYGGTSEWVNSCSTDLSGNVYAAGVTQEITTSSLIATPGAFQTSLAGGGRDAFLVKFNSSGVRQWGTYYGGTSLDEAYSCCTDASGNAYLAGWTASTGTNIATSTGFQAAYGGSSDAFLVQFNSSGVRQWATYYGGTGGDYAQAACTDVSGNVYISGYTSSTNSGTVIASSGAHQVSFGGGNDAFLVKFNSVGSRQWGTYYGGTGNDYGMSACMDAQSNVYIAGYTSSSFGTDIATTTGYQSSYGGGSYDAFLVQFNSSGVRQWGTYYGAGGDDEGNSCSSDLSTGDVYLFGNTSSVTNTVIASVGSYQSSYGGGAYDAFVLKSSSAGNRLWGSYYGGSGIDYARAGCTDVSSGNVYLAGFTSTGSSGFTIASSGSHQNSYGGGGGDAFLAKLYDNCSYSVNAVSSATGAICSGNSSTLIAFGASTYTWLPSNSTGSLLAVTPSVTTSYTIRASLSGCSTVIANSINVAVNPTPTILISNGSVCTGKSYTLIPSGAQTYTFSSGSSIVSPTLTSSYSITGTSSLGCVSASAAVATITVNSLPVLNITGNNSVCINSPISLLANGNVITYTWSTGGNSNLVTLTPSVISVYTVSGTDVNGCIGSATKTVFVNNLPNVIAMASSTSVCSGAQINLSGGGASSYVWTNGVTNSIPFTVLASAVYTVTGTDVNGCKNIASVGIQVNPNPTLAVSGSSTVICEGESANVWVHGANTYSWSTGSTDSILVVNPSTTSVYSVTGINAFGCASNTQFVQNVDACLGLTPLKTNSVVHVFPNPFKEECMIEALEEVDITVVNALGQFILGKHLVSGTNKMNLGLYPAGIYFIQLKQDAVLRTFKVIKE